MLVQHALGVAGGAAGVAKHARVALGSFHPGEVAVLGVDERAETVLAVPVHDDVTLDRRPAVADPVDDRLKGAVVEEHAVLGMVGDEGELVVEQPRIDRVDHAAHPNRAVPRCQVVRVVHRQRRDAVAGL